MDKKTSSYNLNYCAKGSREIGAKFIRETKELTKIADCIEIDLNWPHNLNFEKEIEFLIKLQKEKNIRYVVHAPYFDGGLNAFNKKMRNAALEEVFYSIDVASRVGSKILVLHPAIEQYGLKIQKRKELEIDSYKKIAKYAKKKGISVGLENEAQTNFWFPDRACKFEEIEKIIREVNLNNLGLTLDIGHANVTGEDFVKAIYQFKTKIFHIHAHDNFGKKEIKGRPDPHLPPGDGEICWRKVIKALREINYQGYFAIECNIKGIKKGTNFLEKEKKDD